MAAFHSTAHFEIGTITSDVDTYEENFRVEEHLRGVLLANHGIIHNQDDPGIVISGIFSL